MKLMNSLGLFGMQLLLDDPSDGAGGGGGGTEGVKPGADNDATKPGADGTVKVPDTKVPAAKPDDSRERGILADLAKERKQRQQYEADLKAERAELARERGRVRALSGLEPKSEDDEVDALVKARIAKLYPGIERMTPEQIEKIMAVSERADALEAATEHHWTNHGRQMLNGLTTEATKVLGGKLTDRQTTRLQQAYFQECQNDPKFLERHEAGDQTLITEFVKSYEEDFITPGRRAALAAETERRRNVPSARDRSVVGASGKKLDLSKDSDFAEAVSASFQKHGGSYGD
jgi:hypothetical protein